MDATKKVSLPREVAELESFTTNRKLDASEIGAIRNWYRGAILREQDGTDPDGFAREAIEEVALYLGGAELLKDVRETETECG